MFGGDRFVSSFRPLAARDCHASATWLTRKASIEAILPTKLCPHACSKPEAPRQLDQSSLRQHREHRSNRTTRQRDTVPVADIGLRTRGKAVRIEARVHRAWFVDDDPRRCIVMVPYGCDAAIASATIRGSADRTS
jgi:hypothetical protein